jgi:hypothetical protein
MIWQKLMMAAGGTPGVSTRWRMNITALDGSSSFVRLFELEFRGEPSGPDLTTPADASARASASSIQSASSPAENAFDDDAVYFWQSAAWTGGPEWIEWEFAEPVNVQEIAWLATSGSVSPQDFDVQYFDGSSWQTYWSETGQVPSPSLQISTYPG